MIFYIYMAEGAGICKGRICYQQSGLGVRNSYRVESLVQTIRSLVVIATGDTIQFWV